MKRGDRGFLCEVKTSMESNFVNETRVFSEQEYFKLRTAMIEERRSKGINPFPHKFHVSIALEEFIAKYDYLEKDVILEDVVQSVAGRFLFKLWL